MGRKVSLSLPASRIVLGFYPEDYLAVAGEGGAERLVGMSLGWFHGVPSRHLVSLRGQPVDNWPRSPTWQRTGSELLHREDPGGQARPGDPGEVAI